MIGLEVYATALYRSSKNPIRTYEYIKSFNEVLEQDIDLINRLNGNKKSYQLLKDVIIDHYDIEFSNFIEVMVSDARLDEWNRFKDVFRTVLVSKNLIFDVHVVSAQPLSKEAQERLELKIKNKHNAPCEFRYDVDARLIKGMKVTINHQTVDASVHGSLERIKKEVLL